MFANRYRQRRVAESDARPCFIDFRPTTCVLVNENPAADHFYISEAHLADRGFCTPIAAPSNGPPLPPKPLDDEIAKLKKEWDAVRSEKMKQEESKDTKDKEKEAAAKDATKEAPKDSEAPKETPETPAGPKYYELHPSIFKLRQQAKRRVAQEKRTRQTVTNPTAFPAVPTTMPAAPSKPPGPS